MKISSDEKLKCAKHNKELKLIISDDRHKNYICTQCEFERSGVKIR